jgi:hypothetical protein
MQRGRHRIDRAALVDVVNERLARWNRHHVDHPAAAPGTELHGARGEVVTGVEVRASLANDDLAGSDDLATEALDSQALGVGVPTVAGRRRPLLVSHVAVLR